MSSTPQKSATFSRCCGSARSWCAARAAAIHFGAEILVRAVGPFQDNYLYAGLDPDHAAVQVAVETAAQHLRSPDEQSLIGG